jgi:four helix bundle protein
MYSLTDQVRRSSRSVGAQIAEAWAKRRYQKHFVSKLTDAVGEELETHTGLKPLKTAHIFHLKYQLNYWRNTIPWEKC